MQVQICTSTEAWRVQLDELATELGDMGWWIVEQAAFYLVAPAGDGKPERLFRAVLADVISTADETYRYYAAQLCHANGAVVVPFLSWDVLR